MNIFKSALFLSAILLTGLSACNNQTQTKESSTGDANKMDDKKVSGTLSIDKATSSVVWYGTDPLKTHTGTIGIADGEMKFDDKGKLVGGNITIDMNSITVNDKTPEEKKPNLIGHLKSNDFFASDSFPTSKFELASIEQKDGDNYVLKGNLTLRGRTLGIEVPATITTNDGVTNLKSRFSFDRVKWGVNYNTKSIASKVKDNAINDLIELEVNLNAKK